MRMRLASLKRLKDRYEGESFRFKGYDPTKPGPMGGCFDVIRIDLYDPAEFISIPPPYRDHPFLGIIYRSRRDGSIYFATLGRHLVGLPLKEISKEDIEACGSSDTGYRQWMAKMAVTDPVGLMKIF